MPASARLCRGEIVEAKGSEGEQAFWLFWAAVSTEAALASATTTAPPDAAVEPERLLLLLLLSRFELVLLSEGVVVVFFTRGSTPLLSGGLCGACTGNSQKSRSSDGLADVVEVIEVIKWGTRSFKGSSLAVAVVVVVEVADVVVAEVAEVVKVEVEEAAAPVVSPVLVTVVVFKKSKSTRYCDKDGRGDSDNDGRNG